MDENIPENHDLIVVGTGISKKHSYYKLKFFDEFLFFILQHNF